MATKVDFKHMNKRTYVRIITTTTPPTLTIPQAAKLSNRKETYLLDEINRGKLDWGFSFDRSEDRDANGKQVSPEEVGQKLIVINERWNNWLNRKLNKDEVKADKN